MSKKIKFKCPYCDSTHLEARVSQVRDIIVYNDKITFGQINETSVEDVICAGCEEILQDENGYSISEPEEILEWIERNKEEEEEK